MWNRLPVPRSDSTATAMNFFGPRMNERTPLWYYLLREAEVRGIRRFRGGECLGPLGSRIVAEVLLGVMNADPGHYLNVDPNWRPLTVVFGGSSEPRRIDSLRRFVAFAKNRHPL